MSTLNPIEVNHFNSRIRRYFDHNSGKWYFSLVDTISVTTKSQDARNYWKVLKNRLNKTHNQLVTRCKPHKMESSDGKFYLTDTGDEETAIQILSMVSSESIPLFIEYASSLSSPKAINVLPIGNSDVPPERNKIVALNTKSQSYPQEPASSEEITLKVDMYIEGEILFLETFLAGVHPSDLSVVATCKTLNISGKREIVNLIYKDSYTQHELPNGKFYRQIHLPREIEISKIEALNDHGLVTIKMPILDKSYVRRIKINKE